MGVPDPGGRGVKKSSSSLDPNHPLALEVPVPRGIPQILAPLSGSQGDERFQPARKWVRQRALEIRAGRGGREEGERQRGKERSREQTEEEEVGRSVAMGREVKGRGGKSLIIQPEPPESHSMSTFQNDGVQKDPIHPSDK